MKNKILALVALLIVIGIIVVAVFKFNVDYCYKNHNLVSIEIGQDFNENDIKNITNEVFGKEKIEIQTSDTYRDTLILRVNQISDEQKEKLSNKINEKYSLETTKDSVKVQYIPSYRLIDIAKLYILPMGIATIIILVYMCVKYKKIGLKSVLGQTILLSVLAETLYGAIIAITRFPVNRLVMPGAVTIYFIIITFLCIGYEKKLKAEKDA